MASALYFVIYTGFAHLDRGQEPFEGLFFVMGVLFFLRLMARNIWWASLTPFIAITLMFIFLQVETPFSPDSIQAFLTWVLSMAFLHLCLKKIDKTLPLYASHSPLSYRTCRRRHLLCGVCAVARQHNDGFASLTCMH